MLTTVHHVRKGQKVTTVLALHIDFRLGIVGAARYILQVCRYPANDQRGSILKKKTFRASSI